MVVAGLEGDEKRGTAGSFTGHAQRDNLGVITPDAVVPSLSHHLPFTHNDGAHVRVGRRMTTARTKDRTGRRAHVRLDGVGGHRDARGQ